VRSSEKEQPTDYEEDNPFHGYTRAVRGHDNGPVDIEHDNIVA
jgi:hypothetical protein